MINLTQLHLKLASKLPHIEVHLLRSWSNGIRLVTPWEK
jgi:hypothetical protein